MKSTRRSKNTKTQKKIQKIAKDENYFGEETIDDVQIVINLEKQLEKLKSDSRDLNSELQNIRAEKEIEQQQKLDLEKELELLKKELKLSEQSTESMQLNALVLSERTQNALLNFDKRLECAEEKHRVLENAITKIKQHQEKKKIQAKMELDSKWSAKCQEIEEDEERQVEEIKSMIEKETEEFTKKINSMNEDIKRKDREITRLEKKLHDQSLLMTTEVIGIKNDIQKERREYELQLNAKLAFYKAEVNKLACMNENIKQHYKDKIKSVSKVMDKEKLNMKSLLKNVSENEIQNTVTTLEEKFKKELTNTIQWANHYNELEIQKKAILNELEEETNTNPERSSSLEVVK